MENKPFTLSPGEDVPDLAKAKWLFFFFKLTQPREVTVRKVVNVLLN